MTSADDPTVPDPTVLDPTVLDTAMDTGSDVGEPGERADGGPLTDDEDALLRRLSQDDRAPVVTDAPEDSPAAARAVADDSPLPGDVPPAGGAEDEDAEPSFRPPGR
jgi:hypothetical protein